MKKENLRKIAIYSALSTMLLTGCNQSQVKNSNTPYVPTKNQITTEEQTTEEVKENETIDKIIKEYNNQTNSDICKENIVVETFSSKTDYMWIKGEEYIYDYSINFYNNGELKNCDPSTVGEIYAVMIKNEDGYEPIAALSKVKRELVNVKVNFFKNDIKYEPSDNYIYIINPTEEDYNNLKNADNYIKSEDNKSILLTMNN